MPSDYHSKQISYHLTKLEEDYRAQIDALKKQVSLFGDCQQLTLEEANLDINLPLDFKKERNGVREKFTLKSLNIIFANYSSIICDAQTLEKWIAEYNLIFEIDFISKTNLILDEFQTRELEKAKRNGINRKIAQERAEGAKQLLIRLGVCQTITDTKSRKIFKPSIPNPLLSQVYTDVYRGQLSPSPQKTYFFGEINLKEFVCAFKNNIAKMGNSYTQLEVKKQKEQHEKLKKEQANKVILEVIAESDYDIRNGIPDKQSLLEFIVSKNKYLKLAHYLEKNRVNWIDGCSFAQYGISQFTIITTVDELIHKEISFLINNWDGDGRVFRDCEWNYHKLFNMVRETDNKLMQLYIKLTNE